MIYDVIVLGAGAMGSAAVSQLAQRGRRVLGIDQFHPPHDLGSSHGGTRMIRQAYGEGADYIPLVLRAYELWERLEKDTGKKLLHVTGGLILGAANGEMVPRGIAAAQEHSIPYEVLQPAEVAKRFPAIQLVSGDLAVHEFRAGYLLPEECIRAFLDIAARAGAELHFGERVISWRAKSDSVEVITDRAVYSAGHLVITAGAWAAEALGSLVPVRVTRQVMAWIQPRGGISRFLPANFPVFLSENLEDGLPAYGFPAIDGETGGVKAAVHGSTTECTPDTVDRSIHERDRSELIAKVKRRIPALKGEVIKAVTCLYTMTPDEHFIIGPHPLHASVSIACGFSGHGFKFASVVGEILADLAVEGTTRLPIGMFSPRRFASGGY